MTPVMFHSVAPAARFTLARPMLSTAVVNFHPIAVAPPLPSLPLASSRDGSLFVDRADPTLHWYLPDFVLAPDVDPLFAFAVSQSGQQSNGQPFDVARLRPEGLQTANQSRPRSSQTAQSRRDSSRKFP